VASSTWPRATKEWAATELALAPQFNRLRILVSHLGLVPVVTTIFQNGDGYGFMSQSGGKTLEDAIYKALAETCRIADLALKGEMLTEDGFPKSAEGHALFYAFQEKIPAWLFGDATSFAKANFAWNSKTEHAAAKTTKSIFNCGPLVVARCKSSETQDLFFGSTEAAARNGLVNFERLKNICGIKTLNLHPHFVP